MNRFVKPKNIFEVPAFPISLLLWNECRDKFKNRNARPDDRSDRLNYFNWKQI